MPRAVAVFGGTFDPVHIGHLRSAIELVEHLELSELWMMPCAEPPHGKSPTCSADHRAAMVELAVREEPRLRCDRRELSRSGASYTVDSLAEIRREIGPQTSLSLVMGGDSAASINTWSRWHSLLDLAHIVIVGRPGWKLPDAGEVAHWLRRHRLESAAGLHQLPAGGVWVEELRQLPVSSTEIRTLLCDGKSARYLLPGPVLDYIQKHNLYH